ncbi:mycofactocin-coupled SDR family oxidoreductase [Nocardia sp. CA-107356]|uniref:mycofactocin-coupled SDR family oxidoreductase n=1 Tax=Nocardia sp. CA-107356 TaxID=3239972 RepID=UPI003D90FC26
MTGRVAGKVAFITGAGRGQGRSHAIRLAEEGADVILVDVCCDIPSVGYPMATGDDLSLTAREVVALGRRAFAKIVDVRDRGGLRQAVEEGVDELGRLDVVCANAGIATIQSWDNVSDAIWKDTIDINLTGVWNSVTAALPHLVARNQGSIILTSSTSGIKGHPFLTPYVAAKHGVVGIAKSLANELGQKNIRVNTVHPAGVNTPMLDGLGGMDGLIARDPSTAGIFHNTLPVEVVEPRDISDAVLFLASDESRYVTGLEFTIDAGATNR